MHRGQLSVLFPATWGRRTTETTQEVTLGCLPGRLCRTTYLQRCRGQL